MFEIQMLRPGALTGARTPAPGAGPQASPLPSHAARVPHALTCRQIVWMFDIQISKIKNDMNVEKQTVLMFDIRMSNVKLF